MADDNAAAVIQLHQPAPKGRAMTGAERAKAYRQRKRDAKAIPTPQSVSSRPRPPAPPLTECVSAPSVTPVAVTSDPSKMVTPSRTSTRSDGVSTRGVAPILLIVAAAALSAVGVTVNGWFARSLGATDVAGGLFLAVGAAADMVALVMPSCAARLWQAGRRGTALVGWTLWLVTFAFVVTAGLGFVSTNISDVTLERASRVTPAVTTAQAALADAMAARDRECKGGVGRFCREREAAVADRRRALDGALVSVDQAADPQTDAAIKIVAWISRGTLRPSTEDFAMLRLMLLGLLPQVGGLLMMVGLHAMRPRDRQTDRR
ncbi:hypothetical protein H8A97_10080 [Bradyrhizobium sp. Arg62]|uniref:hypothetical protein n=1 Tax=Bradyrhizobium brasilense TaxID=1419277 RepID=UPI001E470D3F|nr:hypothetical protein [Bradyrhizobium brasilense]MCC8945439.1 hypothetical protein [Bradyrhizobium brasilense]